MSAKFLVWLVEKNGSLICRSSQETMLLDSDSSSRRCQCAIQWVSLELILVAKENQDLKWYPDMPGTVKFFNDQKGFGFISRDGQEDLFVHFSNIIGSGRRTLVDGQEVEFEVGEGRKVPGRRRQAV